MNVGAHTIGRFTVDPGCTRSRSIKPVAGTERCEKEHVGYCLAGRMDVRLTDGTQQTVKAGDANVIPPGHDAEVVGDERLSGLSFRARRPTRDDQVSGSASD